MNLATTLNVHVQPVRTMNAGGQGSGPTAPCPQCGPHHSKNIEPGDLIRFNRAVTVQTPWGDQTYKKDTAAYVLHVLPKIGNADQMLSVNVAMPGALHILEGYHVKMDDVRLDKKGNPNIAPQAVSVAKKSETITKFKTTDGAQVTWVKRRDDPEPDVKTLKDISREEHYLKGKFAITDSVKGKQDRPGTTRITKIYDTSGMPAPYQQGSGATVWVNTYMQKGGIKNVVVQEQNYTTHAFKTRGLLTFDYKNAAQAVGMLKDRYGIKTSMKRLMVNPRSK